MTKETALEMIGSFQIRSYYLKESEDGDVDLLFGDDDPMKEIERLKLDNSVLKTQVKYLMSILYKIPYDQAEELIQ